MRAVVYNLYSVDNNLNDGIESEDQLYASTSKGLFKFIEHDNWVKEEIANDDIFNEIGISPFNENHSSFEVQTAIIDQNNNLFIGTTEGLLIRDAFNQFYYPTYLDDYLENLCVYDCFGVCDGSAVLDCMGECNGSAVYDCEGICDGQNECDDNCISGIYDCEGICDGSSIFDCIGECNGSAIYDCEGVCGGEAECDDNCVSSIYDCAGVCDGPAVLDCAGECEGETLYDCEGVCGGSADCNATSANRVYPNPYLLDTHAKATFLIESTSSGRLEIYDFSMSKVFNGECSLQNQGLSCNWNGLRNNGQKVSNGVYFLKVTTGGRTYWEKLGVINK